MKRVILESPYAGNIEQNIAYAKLCVKDCLLRGESPMASHLLYTQEGILDDKDPVERNIGVEAGLTWLNVAELHVFYVDYGYSSGMLYALDLSKRLGIPMEERKILGGIKNGK